MKHNYSTNKKNLKIAKFINTKIQRTKGNNEKKKQPWRQSAIERLSLTEQSGHLRHLKYIQQKLTWMTVSSIKQDNTNVNNIFLLILLQAWICCYATINWLSYGLKFLTTVSCCFTLLSLLASRAFQRQRIWISSQI